MAKGDDGPAWLAALGIDRTCRLVAMTGGMVTLTRTDDGEHTLWLFDHPEMVGDAPTVRSAYADYLRGHWLEGYYRP